VYLVFNSESLFGEGKCAGNFPVFAHLTCYTGNCLFHTHIACKQEWSFKCMSDLFASVTHSYDFTRRLMQRWC